MSCDCVKDVTKRLTEKFIEKAGPSISVHPNFLAIVFDANNHPGHYVTFTVRGENPPFKKAKGETVNMLMTYCPFCGVHLTKKAPDDTRPTADNSGSGQAGGTPPDQPNG